MATNKATARYLSAQHPGLAVELSAVVVAASPEEPKVLTLQDKGELRLPSGPLEPQHRTLEEGLRAWVEAQTRQTLGYIEQLHTFGDLGRQNGEGAHQRLLSVSYLALAREVPPAGADGAAWSGWYRFFPWEDWRDGRPPQLDRIERALQAWAAAGGEERPRRESRLRLAFGLKNGTWNDERALERYELLFDARLVPEAWRADTPPPGQVVEGERLAADHRQILATAIARLRGHIRYRPLVFELMPPSFTFLQLQRTVEALAGLRLHKPNFRRLVEHQGLVEETGEISGETGGRPARLLRFRREVLLERPAPGMKLPSGRRRR